MAKARMQFTRPEESLRTVCMYCERQRISRGDWKFVKTLVEAPTSHGVCPSCYKEALGDLLVQITNEPQQTPRIA